MALILAIDQGTHSTRAVVFDARGRLIALTRQPIGLQAHSRSEVEQSPTEILASLHTVLDGIFRHPDVDPALIRHAGLATQRSSILAWQRDTGAALSPVLSWQDRRTAAQLKSYDEHEEIIRRRTGLRLSAHYGAGKMQWLLAQVPAVAGAMTAGNLVLGPLASYLLHHLREGRGEFIDDANASRTLLWNLQERDWDPWLLDLFHIPRDFLPDCLPIRADYGVTRKGEIPILAVNGDQTAALHAQGRPRTGTILVNVGTGAFVLTPVREAGHKPAGLLAGVSMSDATSADYYIEGTVNGAWSALAWAEQQFSVSATESKLPGWLEETPDPPVFLNTIGGLGSPWWRPGPDPVFLDSRNKPVSPPLPAAMSAVIESIAFLIQANVERMVRQNPAVDRIRITGGLSQLDGLCQKLANLSGLPLHRPEVVEATARGIAWQAAGCPGDWETNGSTDRFTPRDDAPLGQRYARFLEALDGNTT